MTECVSTRGGHAVESANPIDAEGKPIPLDTTMLYDRSGRRISVKEFKSKINTVTGVSSWVAVGAYEDASEWSTLLPGTFFITKPDSLKQLAKDLDRMVNFERGYGYSSSSCAYTGISGSTCDCCKLKDSSDMCLFAAIKDIAARVNRLCGDSE